MCRHTDPRLFYWDRGTLKRVTLHRKKLARIPPNFWGTLKPPGQAGATFIKFRGKMTHFWQGLRSGRWLTSAPARGHSLILVALCGLAVAGWIAVSDGLIDRNGKPLGTDFLFQRHGDGVVCGQQKSSRHRCCRAALPAYRWGCWCCWPCTCSHCGGRCSIGRVLRLPSPESRKRDSHLFRLAGRIFHAVAVQ